MADRFLAAIEKVLAHEGGYVDDPDDPGGETKFGISKRSYPEVGIANLTRDRAIEIYRRDFWLRPRFDQVADTALAEKLLDLGVNVGTRRAVRMLQEAVNLLDAEANLNPDGILGPQTLKAVNGYRNPEALLAALKFLAAQYYVLLNKPRFLAGWLMRAMD